MQSNNQSNSSFYQNNEEKQNKRIKLKTSFATRRIFKNFISQYIKKNHQLQRLISLKRFSILLTQRKKITFDKFLQNKTRLENRISKHNNIISIKPITKVSQTEINTLNELIPVTPTTTQNKINIEIQLKQIEKKRYRNHITSDYLYFLFTTKKITVEKFYSISKNKIEKSDTLRRVSNLLFNEHNRLNKVA
jgi:hypothetical protein